MWWVACEPRGSGAVVTYRAVLIYREPCLSSAFSFVSVNCLALTLSFVLKSLSVMVENRSREGLQRTPPLGCILAVYGDERVCSRTKPTFGVVAGTPLLQVRVGFDLYHLKSFHSRIVIDDSSRSPDWRRRPFGETGAFRSLSHSAVNGPSLLPHPCQGNRDEHLR